MGCPGRRQRRQVAEQEEGGSIVTVTDESTGFAPGAVLRAFMSIILFDLQMFMKKLLLWFPFYR